MTRGQCAAERAGALLAALEERGVAAAAIGEETGVGTGQITVLA